MLMLLEVRLHSFFCVYYILIMLLKQRPQYVCGESRTSVCWLYEYVCVCVCMWYIYITLLVFIVLEGQDCDG